MSGGASIMPSQANAPLAVAIIIPTFRRPQSLATLLRSLDNSTRRPDEVIVVNNDCRSVTTLPDPSSNVVRVIEAGLGLNLAAARNLGALASRSDVCFFVDDDNYLDPNALAVIAAAFNDPHVNFVAPVILSANSTHIWCAGVKRSAWSTRTRLLYSGVEMNRLPTARRWATEDMPDCFAVRTKVLFQVGGFDDKAFPFHYDEADLCARLRHISVQPYVLAGARVTHDTDASIKDSGAEVVSAFKRHGRARVYVMVRARVWYHRRHGAGLSRVCALAVGIPAWTVVTLWLVLWRGTPPAVLQGVLSATIRGLYDGYVCKIPSASAAGKKCTGQPDTPV